MAHNNNNNNVCLCSICTDIPNPKVCLHLSLAPCCPWSCTTINDDDNNEPCTAAIMGLKRKHVQQQKTNVVSRKKTKTYNDEDWEIKKVLTESDSFGVTCRLLIGKKLAEELVVPVLVGDVAKGIEVKIWDCDTNTMYFLTFKKFISGSYGFNGNWTKDFVARRGLKTGDLIGLHWDQYNKCFDFSILEVNHHYS
ncbi:hypothetical protein L195_g041309 [Trifolium pratense]|uniref:Uncharacterized protein n=2 Tax=Trifolium pratense TaxID=57577 RepID=A0ACB0JYI2_TRIPR|nr:putative B3 domain-containing protein At1g78640 [Trifolium pratense]PNX85242.1 hypothetical protein L195_g041309 [Trifolium pratense]CAJ2649916.1 unnamed protein product [Trifolium pratense]